MRLFGNDVINAYFCKHINFTLNDKLMKKVLLPLIGVSLITVFSAFSYYDNEEEYGNDSVSDTIVSAQTDTVMPIKNLPAEEWAD